MMYVSNNRKSNYNLILLTLPREKRRLLPSLTEEETSRLEFTDALRDSLGYGELRTLGGRKEVK